MLSISNNYPPGNWEMLPNRGLDPEFFQEEEKEQTEEQTEENNDVGSNKSY
jgi:hypothetical protein